MRTIKLRDTLHFVHKKILANRFIALQDAQGVCTSHKTRLIKDIAIILTILKEEKTNEIIPMENLWQI